MTNAQTEARAIAPERIWVTGSFHMGGYASGSWNVQKLSNSRTDIGEVEYVRSDIHATALAAKEAVLAEVHQQYVDANEARIDAEAQLAEANKALERGQALSSAFLRYFNPNELPEDQSQQWQQLERWSARRAREQGGE